MNEFNPDRIDLARKYRGWDKKELAARTHVSPSTISLLINGRREFTERYANTLARTADLPLTFFMLEDHELAEDQLTFRKLARMPKSMTDSITSEFTLLAGAYKRLTDMVHPEDKTAWLTAIAPKNESDARNIERIALEVRSYWGIPENRAVGDLTRNIERSGICVVPLNTPVTDTVGDGVTKPSEPESQPIIGFFPTNKPGDRQRFTIAHELGHLILHRYRRPSDWHLAEDEANMFASALLLPASAAKATLTKTMTLKEYPYVKAAWGMSISALIRRSMDLGIIDYDRWRILTIQMVNRGWNRFEPVEVADERPILFKQIVGSAFGNLQDYVMPTVSKEALEGFLGLSFDMVNHWCNSELQASVNSDIFL